MSVSDISPRGEPGTEKETYDTTTNVGYATVQYRLNRTMTTTIETSERILPHTVQRDGQYNGPGVLPELIYD